MEREGSGGGAGPHSGAATVSPVRELGGASDPAALTGSMIGGGIGIAWALWGASGLSRGPAAVVRVAAIAVGVLIFVGSALVQRSARRPGRTGPGAARRDGPGSLFSSPGYRRVVAAEALALVGGAALLGSTEHSEYTIAWFATVVGVHFVAFGRLFWAGFYWLGAAMLAAGTAGAVVGFAGGGSGAIRAVAGLVTAASLFAAGGWTIVAVWEGLRA